MTETTHNSKNHSVPSRCSLFLAIGGASGAKPLSFWFGGKSNAAEVEPLDGALEIVTSDHFPVGDLVTNAVSRLVRVHGHVQYVCTE